MGSKASDTAEVAPVRRRRIVKKTTGSSVFEDPAGSASRAKSEPRRRLGKASVERSVMHNETTQVSAEIELGNSVLSEQESDAVYRVTCPRLKR